MTERLGFSAEYLEFCRLRGKNPSVFKSEHRPTTPEELNAAQERTTKLLDLIHDPNYEVIRSHFLGISSNWMREGKLTEQQHMEIFRAYEIITVGQTTEDFLQTLPDEDNS